MLFGGRVSTDMKGLQNGAFNVVSLVEKAVRLGLDKAMVAKNVTVAGRRTSLRLEPEMWDSLCEIGAREGLSLHQLCTEIGRHRGESSLTAAIRVYVLCYFRAAATERGHRAAGHGALRRKAG